VAALAVCCLCTKWRCSLARGIQQQQWVQPEEAASALRHGRHCAQQQRAATRHHPRQRMVASYRRSGQVPCISWATEQIGGRLRPCDGLGPSANANINIGSISFHRNAKNDTWHRRRGHLNESSMKTLRDQRDSAVLFEGNVSPCKTFALGKCTKQTSWDINGHYYRTILTCLHRLRREFQVERLGRFTIH